MCAEIDQTRETALVADPALPEPLTNRIATNPAAARAFDLWNVGQILFGLLGPGAGSGRNFCNRVGVDSIRSLDANPQDGFTDSPPFLPTDAVTLNPVIPEEILVPQITLHTVAFWKTFLEGDHRYMRYSHAWLRSKPPSAGRGLQDRLTAGRFSDGPVHGGRARLRAPRRHRRGPDKAGAVAVAIGIGRVDERRSMVARSSARCTTRPARPCRRAWRPEMRQSTLPDRRRETGTPPPRASVRGGTARARRPDGAAPLREDGQRRVGSCPVSRRGHHSLSAATFDCPRWQPLWSSPHQLGVLWAGPSGRARAQPRPARTHRAPRAARCGHAMHRVIAGLSARARVNSTSASLSLNMRSVCSELPTRSARRRIANGRVRLRGSPGDLRQWRASV